MDKIFLRDLKNNLKERFNNLLSIKGDHSVHHLYLKHFFSFIEEDFVISSILEELKLKCRSAESTVGKMISEQQIYPGNNEEESAAISYFMIKKCISESISEVDIAANEFEVGKWFGTVTPGNDSIEVFKKLFIYPLYLHISERITKSQFMIAILKKYKQKCEWFKKEDLFNLYKGQKKKAEDILFLNSYEYLHDQGINFFLEPKSGSAGKVDLIAIQTGDDRVMVEAKVFDSGGRGKSYIIDGFNQLYTYTCDYNEPFGYLVIFKVCEKGIKFSVPNQEVSIPFVNYNGKTIFFIVIDIFQGKPASKKGKITDIEISEKDLFREA